MGGVPINSLEDLLLLQQIKNQADPVYSGIQALADGVALGIEEKRQELKEQKAENERQARIMKAVGNTNTSKITTSINEKGQASYKIEPIDVEKDSLKIQREDRLTKQMSLQNATKLRTEFEKLPQVKDFVTVNTNVSAMESLLDHALVSGDETNLVAVDQGLITMYNKLTDPQSVVRESEYARTPGNLPVVNRIYGAIQKLQQGGAGLTNDDRKALVLAAKIILKERGEPYNEAVDQYNNLAVQYDLDPTMVTKGAKRFETDMKKKIDVKLEEGTPLQQTSKGTKYKIISE